MSVLRFELTTKETKNTKKVGNCLTASRRRLRQQVCLFGRYRTANKREFSRINFRHSTCFSFLVSSGLRGENQQKKEDWSIDT